MKTKILLLWLLAGLAAAPAIAQSSASYTLEEQTCNAGGHPLNGSVLVSSSYRIRLDAIGDALVATGLASASYRAGSSFLAAYPPPGEVVALWFPNKTGLSWSAESSVGTYSVYRDLVSALPGGDYGACLQQDLTATSTTDAETPGAGEGWFYLVTAENRLGEEGTKGRDTFGNERRGEVCP